MCCRDALSVSKTCLFAGLRRGEQIFLFASLGMIRYPVREMGNGYLLYPSKDGMCRAGPPILVSLTDSRYDRLQRLVIEFLVIYCLWMFPIVEQKGGYLSGRRNQD